MRGMQILQKSPNGANSAYVEIFSKGWDFPPASASGLPRPSGAERADQSFQAAFREPIPCLPRDSIEVGVS
jgi:hypothetical protein